MNLGPEKADYIPPIHKTESRPRSSKTGSLLLPILTYFPWIFIKPKKRQNYRIIPRLDAIKLMKMTQDLSVAQAHTLENKF